MEIGLYYEGSFLRSIVIPKCGIRSPGGDARKLLKWPLWQSIGLNASTGDIEVVRPDPLANIAHPGDRDGNGLLFSHPLR